MGRAGIDAATAHRTIRLGVPAAAIVLACAGSAQAALIGAQTLWSWNGSAVAPTMRNAMCTPCVVDLNGDGVPEVIFATTGAESNDPFGQVGFLRIVNGLTGFEVMTVTDAAVLASAHPAAADLDGDGGIEIVTIAADGVRLVAFDAAGALLWFSDELEGSASLGAPTLADLDGDGDGEIIVGRQVFDHTGALLWTGAGTRGGSPVNAPLAVAGDVDAAGTQEVVAGPTVYTAGGAVAWTNTKLPDGPVALLNADADPQAEIALVGGGQLWILEHTMVIKHGPTALAGTGDASAPLIADLDGDGSPEIVVSRGDAVMVFDAQAQPVMQFSVVPPGIGAPGLAAFDLDGDGVLELLMRDAQHVVVRDGATAALKGLWTVSGCAWTGYPVVADVNADGAADVLVTANTPCGIGADRGVRVFTAESVGWPCARGLWNQHAYQSRSIRDDATLPPSPEGWSSTNTFRVNDGCSDAPPPPPCPPDVAPVGGDGVVNLADLNAVLANFGQRTSVGDATGDGAVNLADLNAVLAVFGSSCP